MRSLPYKLFCRVDDQRGEEPKHAQASLYPSKVATLTLLFALKGRGNRTYYRWISRNLKHLCSRLPERTCLFRLYNTHEELVSQFMAQSSLIGVIDGYGIELIHPRWEGCSQRQVGRKGESNRRWIVGGKLCLLLNHFGQVVDRDVDTANVYEGSAPQHLVDGVVDEMLVFADTGFNKTGWHPSNLKRCARGEWNERMIVETVLSMLTVVCHFKKVEHRAWSYFESRVGWTMALFNILVEWNDLKSDDSGFVKLSIANFSL